MSDKEFRRKAAEKKIYIAVALFMITIVGLYLLWINNNAMPVVKIPNPPMPRANARDYFLRALELKKKASTVKPDGASYQICDAIYLGTWPETSDSTAGNSGAPRYTVEYTQVVLEKYQPMFVEVRKGLAYEYREPPCRAAYTPYVFPGQLHDITRTICADAHVKSYVGDWNGATQDVLDTLEIGAISPKGGPLICQLVGLIIQQDGLSEAWALPEQLTAVQAKAAARRMERIMARQVSAVETMQECKWAEQAGLLDIFRRSNWQRTLAYYGAGVSTKSPLDKLNIYTLNKRAIMRNVTRYMDALVTEAKKPYPQQKPVPLPSDPICRNYCSHYDKLQWKWHSVRTQDALLTVRFAMQAYHLERKQYPSSLRQLMPAYLDAIPEDPFTDHQPLRYHTTGDTFVLYSIGPDGKDDGGVPSSDGKGLRAQSSLKLAESSTGDIVARVNIE